MKARRKMSNSRMMELHLTVKMRKTYYHQQLLRHGQPFKGRITFSLGFSAQACIAAMQVSEEPYA